MIIAILSILTVLSLTYAVLVTALAVRASRRIERYEYFFRDTVVDIDHTRNIFDQLVNKREYLADNPDIQQIQKVFAVTLDILQGYIEYGRQELTPKKEGTEKEEEKEE